MRWGIWGIPERDLDALGDIAGRRVLELGCGAAAWSLALLAEGALPVAMDLSERQLAHAAQRRGDAPLPLVQASAEQLPFDDRSFDVVFCDFGAMTFADPYLTVPEAARVLRSGGLFAFNTWTPVLGLCTDWNVDEDWAKPHLVNDYFGMYRFDDGDTVEFQLPYGAWIRLFRGHELVVEDIIELRPAEGATTSYTDSVPLDWARRWPGEHIWKLRKSGG